MTKILYVITKSNFGGAQRYVYELATRLPKDKFQCEVVLGRAGALKTKLEEAGIPVHSIDTLGRDVNFVKDIQSFVKLYKIFRQTAPDVVHLNSPKIGAMGAVAAKLAGVKKVIYTNHGWPFREQRGPVQKAVIKFLSWLTIVLGDITIVLSEKEKNDVKYWPIIEGHLRLISNSISPFDLIEKHDALLHLVGPEVTAKIENEDLRVVGTISELHKNKGLNFAIEGIALLADKRTVFIVIGDGEERETLERKIHDSYLGDQIFLVGAIDNARAYLHAFDYFLLSSIKEGLPYAIMEAGLAGVPVITTNVGGIPELVTNLNEGLVISPQRSQEIRHALIYVENHPEDIKRFAENLKNKISTVYNFENMLTSIIKLYA